MIALFVTICHWFLELLTPPDIRQIQYITRECVSIIQQINLHTMLQFIKNIAGGRGTFPWK